eukprot:COSAG03_NODE_355_length_8649_cov_96.396491_1_plen_41_part_00
MNTERHNVVSAIQIGNWDVRNVMQATSLQHTVAGGDTHAE